MVDTRRIQSDPNATTFRGAMRVGRRPALAVLALTLAAAGLAFTISGGAPAGRGSILPSAAAAAVTSLHPAERALAHQSQTAASATTKNVRSPVVATPVPTTVAPTTTPTTQPAVVAPAPVAAPAPAPAPAPAAAPAPVAAQSDVAALVAQVIASGINPGSNWSWSMGDTATHCSVMTGAGTGCTYGSGGQEFTVFAGTPNLALVAHELANAETQNDAVPSLMDQVSAAENGTSWSPTDAVATCLVAHFMGFQDGASGAWQCPAALGTIVADNINA